MEGIGELESGFEAVEEFLIHEGYRNRKGSLGVEARFAKAETLPLVTMRLPRDICYDIVMFSGLRGVAVVVWFSQPPALNLKFLRC